MGLASIEATIRIPQPGPLTIEWLVRRADGFEVLATRTMSADKAITIAITPSADRFVRFSRPGAAPVTVPSARLVEAAGWRLPDATAGGELVALIDSAPVMPVAYQISGDSTRTINRGDDDITASTLFARGLFAGHHQVVPVYQGGLTGDPVPVVVEAAKSTVVRLQPEPVGEAFVTAPPASCATATMFAVSLVTQSPATGTLRRSVFHTSDVSACQWLIAGLKPGRYDVSLRGPSSASGRQGIDIVAQSRASIALSAAVVNVTGRVRYGDAPAANMNLLFTIDKDGFAASTVTESDGTYTLTLDRPGDYRVMLTDASKQEMRSARIALGDNTVDFTIARGATIRARVSNQSGPDNVVVDIRSHDASSFFSWKDLKNGAQEAEWSALAYGTYELSAKQGTLASDTQTVIVDADHPEATIDLRLDETRTTLTLRDEAGQPVPQARFFIVIPQPKETSPGVYALSGVPPGTRLRIRASSGPLVPTCRIVPRDQSIDVVMASGRPVTLQFPEALRSLGANGFTLVGLAGAECPVPLGDFAATPLASTSPDTSQFLIQNFPLDERLTLIGPRGPRMLVPAANGVLQVMPQVP